MSWCEPRHRGPGCAGTSCDLDLKGGPQIKRPVLQEEPSRLSATNIDLASEENDSFYLIEKRPIKHQTSTECCCATSRWMQMLEIAGVRRLQEWGGGSYGLDEGLCVTTSSPPAASAAALGGVDPFFIIQLPHLTFRTAHPLEFLPTSLAPPPQPLCWFMSFSLSGVPGSQSLVFSICTAP